MRILFVNWARISDGTHHGGGVNGYSQQLALELVARGHEVSWLLSGSTYTPGVAGGIGACEARRLDDWRGVRVFEIVNSPVVAPGPCQHANPDEEVSSPALEAEFLRLLGLIEPDVVHFHNIEGLSAGCIGAARGAERGRVVVYSLHNYHTVCPQAYLMRQGRTPCRSFDSGRACVGCVGLPGPRAEQERRAAEYGAAHAPAPVPEVVRERWGLFGGSGRGKKEAEQLAVVALPGRAVVTVADTVPSRARGSAERHVELPLFERMGGEEWAPLSNEVEADEIGDGRNGYADRREAMVRALSGCSCVLAVSDFVARKFASMGVSERVLRTVHIGSRMTEVVRGCPEVCVTSAVAGRAVRLVFLGYHNYYKGLHVLADALDLLAPEYLARLDLKVCAKGIEGFESRLRRLEGRLAGLAIGREYAYEEVPSLVSGRDLGVVPSVWWDNGPQTVMEFFACGVPVLGAAVGGIPDFVRDGHNGLLFRGNDRCDLARRLAEVVRRPEVVGELRRNVRAPKDMAAHGAEMEAIYAGLRRGE